jgi:hypothetical protein
MSRFRASASCLRFRRRAERQFGARQWAGARRRRKQTAANRDRTGTRLPRAAGNRAVGPPTRFDDFWQLVRTCVRDDGRVAFVDESDQSKVNDDVRIVGGVPLAGRPLADGRTLDVIKLFWNPDDLAARLRALGWTFRIRRVHDIFIYGVGSG